jgi:hypothetical protein
MAELGEKSWGDSQLVFAPIVGVFTNSGVGENPNFKPSHGIIYQYVLRIRR